MGLIQNRDGIFESNLTHRHSHPYESDTLNDEERCHFDVSRYISHMVLTHAYGMTDRNYGLLSGLIMSLVLFPVLLQIPQQGSDAFSTPLRAHLTIVVIITFVVISIHSPRAIWLRLLLIIFATVCPIFATMFTVTPYESRFTAGFVLVMTPLTGYAVREWFVIALWSLVVFVCCAICECLKGWDIGFHALYLTRTYELIYKDASYAYAVSIDHSRLQFATIMGFALVEFVSLLLVSFTVLMFIKAEVFTSLYLLCMKPQMILDMMQGSYIDQEAVIPAMIALHFVGEVKSLLETNTLDLNYFRDALDGEHRSTFNRSKASMHSTKDVDYNNLHMSSNDDIISPILKPGRLKLQSSGQIAKSSDNVNELAAPNDSSIMRESAERHPFADEVMTFIKNEISSPPCFPMGPFINLTIQHNYDIWTTHIYIPTTWHFYCPYVYVIILGCVLDSAKYIFTYTMLDVILNKCYEDSEDIYTDTNQVGDLSPMADLDYVINVNKTLQGVSILGGIFVVFIGVLCITSSIRGAVMNVQQITMKFLVFYLFYSLVICAMHQYLLVALRDHTMFNEVALSYTQDSFFWILLIAMAPYKCYTTHLAFAIRFCAFAITRVLVSRPLIGEQKFQGIFFCIVLMTAPFLRNMAAFRRHIFSATVSGRILVSDNLHRGLGWALKLDEEAWDNPERVGEINP
eukprot:GHVH01003730.1.p1 GENE.GHVH01003730.1~~GHVH01003730.1.p1  ORF type:complete len:687 (-),score=64.32 GHVH01003730.1:318-2378(-)